MRINKEKVEHILSLVNESLTKLYTHDKELILRGGMERSINYRFGMYFNDLLSGNNLFEGLVIDLEYNKNGFEPKRTKNRPNGVRPDLIIHERGSNKKNLLVVEFKGWWNKKKRVNDIVKLEDFIAQQGEYCYAIGMLIDIKKNIPKLSIFLDYSIEMINWHDLEVYEGVDRLRRRIN